MTPVTDGASGTAPLDPSSAESTMNLALLDPPRWGWTAGGGIADVLPPHERSRRRSTCLAFRKDRRRRFTAMSGNQNGSAAPTSASLDPSVANTPSVSTAASAGGQEGAASVAESQQSGTQVGESSDAQCGDAAASALPTGPAATALPTTTPVPPPAVPPAAAAAASFETPLNNKLPKGGRKIHWKTLERLKRNGLSPKQPPDSCSKFGIENKYLGMLISPAKPDPSEAESTTKSTREKLECSVQAMKDGVLDMYSYHRGREGMEPRDHESWELLCSQEVTDTNYDWDAPKTVLSVVVEFPLGDDEEKSGDNDAPTPVYKETIEWDLSNTSTKSPVDFANDIAQEFGLSFGQMTDLAMSIQQQIDGFVQQNFTYSAPLAYKDPQGNERRYVGPTLHTQRYGQAISVLEGGMRLTRQQVSSRQQKVLVPASASKSQSGGGSTAGGSAASRRKSIEKVERFREVIYDEPLEEVDENLKEEVLNRSRSASKIDVRNKCPAGETLGNLEKKKDFHCHICHKKCNVTYNFACGIVSHAYCLNHCRTRFGIGEDPDKGFVFPYCPICCLACTCSKCRRKLDNVTRDFTKACADQGTKPTETRYEDVLDKCDKAPSSAGTSVRRVIVDVRKKVVAEKPDAPPTPPPVATPPPPPVPESKPTPKGRKPSARKFSMVPKAPLLDFPREVCGLIDIEPGTTDDYLKVYTNDGAYLVDEYPSSWNITRVRSVPASPIPPTSPQGSNEDGNVDFCNDCERHGSLLCCDTCPRAFHHDCVDKKARATSEETWVCPVCKQEQEGLEGDVVDGKKSMDLINATLLEIDPTDEANLKAISTLSKIHEMLLKLMEYDFGYIFSEPVGNVEGYRDVVKTPMDLGTICSKLINGDYVSMLQSDHSCDDVILAVLKDIELVWHNCYSFNEEGSAVYRMATVVSRRAQMIFKSSFQNEFSEAVKQGVEEFARACQIERGKNPRLSTSTVFSTDEEKALRARKPRGKHKITVKVNKVGSNRPVAVIDPSLGRVIKIYSTTKTAGQAAQALANVGNRCEWQLTGDIKPLVQRSSTDMSLLLFGYRWVMLDALRGGKVIFPKAVSDLLEMKYEDNAYVFMSIEEALSFPKLPKATKIGELRDKLQSLEHGVAWVEICGMQWRRPEIQNQKQCLESGNVNGDSAGAGGKNGLIDGLGISQLSKIVKEDLVSCRKLIGFDSVEAAYQDWMHTIAGSPTFPKTEAKSMLHFKEYYLNGDRNVDGLYWRGVGVDPQVEVSQSDPFDAIAKIGKSNGQGNQVTHSLERTPKNGLAISTSGEVSQDISLNPPADDSLQIEMSTDIQLPLGKRKRLDGEMVNSEGTPRKKVNGSCIPEPLGEDSAFPVQASSIPLVENDTDVMPVET